MAAHVAGEAAAFDALFRRCAPEVLRLVRRHVSEEDVARDVVLHRDLAMKILHGQYKAVPSLRKSFLDEAQITAQLAHPSSSSPIPVTGAPLICVAAIAASSAM